MAKILEMPKLSPTMEEGVLSAWHKKEGDAVQVDDLLAEVETDKATMEFRAFDKTTILKILVPAGSQVKLGQPVAIVGNPGEDVSGLAAQAGGATQAPAPAAQAAPAAAPTTPTTAPATPKAAPATPPAAAVAPVKPVDTLAPPAQRRPPMEHVLDRTAFPGEAAEPSRAGDGRILASPYVRKVARERGIDLQGATGTGPGGRVVPADLESMGASASAAIARIAPAPTPAAPSVTTALAYPADEARPLSQMRKAIARRLTESKTTVPHFYLTVDVDAGELVKMREEINGELAASGDAKAGGDAPQLKVSVNDLLIKACAVALVAVPECNASFTPEAILVHRRVDISVAVAIPDGLVTPVLRNADQKSIVAIAREVRELAGRARARKLKPEEMMDGTFSISNLGMFGIDEFSAVINPPEGAILAVGQVREVPVVHDGAVVAGKRLAMTLSCDHRVVDGAVGAAFLAELRRLIEHPLRVLTG
ncbi:MAG TPA: pyruvate dehydrogenase complex dihydrolipoamide acetyltransferase [Polyangiaceae bacterium]